MMGIVFGPLLFACVASLLWQAGVSFKAGQHAQAAIPLVFVLGMLTLIGSGSIARSMMFPGARQALPAPGSERRLGSLSPSVATHVFRGWN